MNRNYNNQLACPFCCAEPIIDMSVIQPNGHQGAMHISHTVDCYITLLIGARNHAGSTEGWTNRCEPQETIHQPKGDKRY